MSRRSPRLAAVTLLLVLGGGCVPKGLSFRVDDRVSITAPRDRSIVTLPVELRWTASDLDDVEAFAVYIDRAPVAPGKLFQSSGLDAIRTTEHHLLLAELPSDGDDRQRYTATIVLLDSEGRRHGESAFEVTFDVRRGGT